jgi:UDPglucose 6-dehydrogenase
MNICVVGTGYVGLVTGACLAEAGHRVTCVDCDENKVDALRKGQIPIYEPGLEPIVRNNHGNGRLSFTTELASAVRTSRMVFIAVGTPPAADGSACMKAVHGVAKQVGQALNDYKVIVTKSTVPVGTAQELHDIISAETNESFDIASNPEFLREGTAVRDFQEPDRVVIGADSRTAATWLREAYASFDTQIVEVSTTAAEMIKYAANCFLAARISMINEMANISRAVGVDIDEVRAGIGLDARIGTGFLYPGIGYGGSCFPKDVPALRAVARKFDVPTPMLDATDLTNADQKKQLAERIKARFGDRMSDRIVGIWGLAFKANTDDIRESPAMKTIEILLEAGAHVRVHDPIAMDNACAELGDRVEYCENPFDCIDGAHAVVIATEWDEYRNADKFRILEGLASPIVFDGRNLYEPRTMQDAGFEYHSIGRPVRNSVEATVAG